MAPGGDFVDVRRALDGALEMVAVHWFVKEGFFRNVLETRVQVRSNLGVRGGFGSKGADGSGNEGLNGGHNDATVIEVS